jgi:hypothetical protein
MNNLDRVVTHQFSQRIIEDSGQIIKKRGFKKDDYGVFDDSDLCEFEYYLNNLTFYFIHLLDLCKILEMAVKLLSNFKYDSKNVISQGDQLTYNVENYIIRLASLPDRILQTINAAFFLGIDEKDVNESVVINNDKVVRTEIPLHFRALRKIIGQNTAARNIIVHKHSVMDKDLRKIQMLYHGTVTMKIRDSLPTRKDDIYLRQIFLKRYVSSKKIEFNNLNESCFEALLIILDDLNLQYSKMQKLIK